MDSKMPKLIDIEGVLKSKNPTAAKWIPKFLISYLKRIIHQEEINQFLLKNGHLYGIEFTSAIIREFNITYHLKGISRVEKEGRYIFAANHPLGGLDGVILMDAIAKNFNEVKFPVNDILMNLDNLKPLFLPINKHGSQTQESAEKLENAYKSNDQILMFPAGLVSRKNGNTIRDLEWKRNFVKKAIEHKRDIVPVFIDGHNSKFFYNLAHWRKKLGIKINLEMLYLVDELFKQKNAEITLTFGKPIKWEDLKKEKNLNKTAEKIKEKVYNLEKRGFER